jgi:hypothetical protein
MGGNMVPLLEPIREGGSMNRIVRRLQTVLFRGSLGALILLSACNGQGAQGDDGEVTTELAASDLVSPLDGTYKIKVDGSRVPPREDELPVPLGTVEGHWYRSGGNYVIAFKGLNVDETGPLCPGSSIQTDVGFEHVTNSPTEEGACEGAENIAGEDAGVRTCGPLVLYITEIPEDTEGDLFATVEQYAENGSIVGVTGVVEADMSAAPEIDLGAEGFTLPEGFLEGTTEVTC